MRSMSFITLAVQEHRYLSIGQLSLAYPLGSLNRVPALTGWGKGENVISATCDPKWHISSRSGEAIVNCYAVYSVYFTLTY